MDNSNISEGHVPVRCPINSWNISFTTYIPINSSFFFVSFRIWCQDQEHAAIPAHRVESLWGDASTIADGEMEAIDSCSAGEDESVSWSNGFVQILGTSWNVGPLWKENKIERSNSYNEILFFYLIYLLRLINFNILIIIGINKIERIIKKWN